MAPQRTRAISRRLLMCFALPVCALSPDHGVVEAARQEAEGAPPTFFYRSYRDRSGALISPTPSDEPSRRSRGS